MPFLPGWHGNIRMFSSSIRRGRPSTAAARTWISPSHACRLTYGFAERTGFLSVNHATQGGSLSLSTWGVAVMEESAR